MTLWDRLFGDEGRRRRLLRRAPPGPLRDFLAVPFPARSADCREVRFVAVDLETTGLDTARDAIVAIGRVELDGRAVDLSTARHLLVAPGRAMPEPSAVVHGIGDDAAAAGATLAGALADLLAALAGKVLVAHNAAFELAMIDTACARVFGTRFAVPAVDTLALARRRLDRPGATPPQPAQLRLDALRRRHNLPRYRAHSALSDALAAAELFLAQLAEREPEREPDRGVPLRAVLMR